MSSPVVAVIPIRSLANGKARLAGAIPPELKAALIRRMLTRVVGAAAESGAIDRVVVVSEDPSALAFANELDCRIVPLRQDADHPGLLGALDQARCSALAAGASALLVLFGDLPLLDADDVRNLVRRDGPVVIAPDRHGTGTNALLLRPNAAPPGEGDFQFQFGAGSFARHVAEAHRLGLDTATHISSGTAFDLDTPDDLAELLELAGDDVRALVAEAGT